MNPREELLNIWTNLKGKLTLFSILLKNKNLIKDALEFHANRSSEILSDYHSKMQHFREREKLRDLSQGFTKKVDFSELDKQFKPTTPLEQRHQPDISSPWKDYWRIFIDASSWNHFFQQRQRNQQIVEDCKVLITKLQEFFTLIT